GSWRLSSWSPSDLVRESLSQFDLDVDAGRKVESHQRVDGLRGRRVDVDQPLVRAHLEVLPRVLVLERTADHAVDVLLGGQGHRTGDGRAGALNGLDDVLRGLVERLMIVRLQSDADFVLRHRRVSFLLAMRLRLYRALCLRKASAGWTQGELVAGGYG